jgi:predicted negative regulator of RcsB-dependent stress response
LVTDKTEEEQVEALKNWFSTNGRSLVVGIVLSLGVVFGYQTWEKSAREQGEKASDMYENLTAAVALGPMGTLSEENKSTANFIANQLKTEFPDTTYAHFAAMQLAKLDVEAGELEAAAQELQWVLEHKVEKSLAGLVRLRLAQVKLGQGEYEAALALLDQSNSGANASAYAELRGDIYYAMDQIEDARQAYQQAVASLQEGTTKPMLNMKLEDLVLPEVEISADEQAMQAEEDTQ